MSRVTKLCMIQSAHNVCARRVGSAPSHTAEPGFPLVPAVVTFHTSAALSRCPPPSRPNRPMAHRPLRRRASHGNANLPRAARALTSLTVILMLGCAGGAGPAPTTAPEGADQAVSESPPEGRIMATIPNEDPIPDPVIDRGMLATATVDPDTVEPGRFDGGRMWTFEYPPTEYFRSTYGIAADQAWFDQARLGALRIPGCSASFVSASGLLATNHHCARDHVTAVQRTGESLLDNGFYAANLADERAIEDFTADQLVEIIDISDQVDAALQGVANADRRSETREQTLDSIQESLLAERGGEDAGWHVETISLYQGGRYSAYIFRRYTDVRLVMAPELQLGYFGGDPDNFTYPRYSLDFSFLRVYGDDGTPLDTSDNHFRWATEGVTDGDAVFVIGNPGSTTRIQTVAQLVFRRDVSDRALLEFINSRIDALQRFYDENPEVGEALDLRNDLFSLLNSQKSYRGVISGLHDPSILARKQAFEREFREALASDAALESEYGDLIDRMAEIQEQKREIGPGFGSFLALTNPAYGGSTLTRAILAFQYLNAAQGGAADQADEFKTQFLEVRQQPLDLEELLLQARFEDFARNYGLDNPSLQQMLGGRSPEVAAASVVQGSALADSATAARALESGSLGMDDPAMALLRSMLGLLGPFQQAAAALGAEEEEIGARLGRARFDVFGSDVPPDATFSLRIADGVVKPYEYNGTEAPVVTTFYGLYDRYHAHRAGNMGDAGDWDLPERWLEAEAQIELATPLNFVSTADIIGGNSGSPIVNADLEVVGLAFDGNIESLPGDYIFRTESARTVGVDARGILEALESVYQAERLVSELRSGAVAR